MQILKFLFFGFLFTPFLFRLDVVQEKSKDVVLLKPDSQVKQSFIAKHHGLYQIRIFANNPKLLYREPIYFNLKDKNEEKTILKTDFTGFNVGTNTWIRFQFEPEWQSKGYEYTFILETLSSRSGITNPSFIELKQSVEKIPQLKGFLVNGQEQNGSLVFKTYYKLSPIQFLQDAGADLLSRINGDSEFIFLYLLTLFFLTIITGYAFLFK